MTTIASMLPDMSAITSVTGLRTATTDRVIAQLSTGAFVDPANSSAAATLLTRTPSAGLEPATIVDLSDHAKAMLAKAATDQFAATRLEAQVQAWKKGKTDGLNHSSAQNSSKKSIFDQIHDLGRELTTSVSPPNASKRDVQISASAGDDVKAGIPIWQQQGRADNIAILQAGAQLYNRPQAMQDLAKNGGQFASSTEGHVVSDDVLFVFTMHSQIARTISDLQDKGKTDEAQALSDALQNGTLKFQKASDVPDLNMQSWMIHFADAGGGGEMASTSVKPTGAIKAAIDGGKALAVNMGDRGDFYVTW
jgi:hypothetical protein